MHLLRIVQINWLLLHLLTNHIRRSKLSWILLDLSKLVSFLGLSLDLAISLYYLFCEHKLGFWKSKFLISIIQIINSRLCVCFLKWILSISVQDLPLSNLVMVLIVVILAESTLMNSWGRELRQWMIVTAVVFWRLYLLNIKIRYSWGFWIVFV